MPPAAYTVKNRTPLRLGNLRLRFKAREKHLGLRPYEQRDRGDYTPNVNADILADKLDEDGSVAVIGFIHAQMVQTSRINNQGLDASHVCDEASRELDDMYNTLFEQDGEPRPFHRDALSMICGDILYIHEVYIQPEYRGFGIGLLALDGYINGLPTFVDGFAVLTPYSITREMPIDEDHPSYAAQCKEAHGKLQEYFKKLGFEKLASPRGRGGAVHMGRWQGHNQPRVEEVVPHLMRRGI